MLNKLLKSLFISLGLLIFLMASNGCSKRRGVECSVQNISTEAIFKESEQAFIAEKVEGIRNPVNIVPDQFSGEYIVELKIGGQTIPFAADTGSSNLVVSGKGCRGCTDTAYTPGGTHLDLGETIKVGYTSGSAEGKIVQDTVELACGEPNFKIKYDFVMLTSSKAIPNILGLGYPALAISAHNKQKPFFDALIEQHKDQLQNAFSMRFCGELEKANSNITFGGIETALIGRKTQFIPIIKESYYVTKARGLHVLGWVKSGNSWSQQKGATTQLGDDFPKGTGHSPHIVVDSGTTMNLLPITTYKDAISLMRSASRILGTGVPDSFWEAKPKDANYARKIDIDTQNKYPTLRFEMLNENDESVMVDMTPKAYFKEVRKSGGVTASFRQSKGDVLLGQPFMEQHGVIFDRANKRIGFVDATDLCNEGTQTGRFMIH